MHSIADIFTQIFKKNIAISAIETEKKFFFKKLQRLCFSILRVETYRMFGGRVEETNAAFSNQFVEQLLFYTSHEIAVHDRRSSGGGVGETAAPLPRVD